MWTWRYSKGVERSDPSRTSGRSCGIRCWKPVSTNGHVNANAYQALLRQHVVKRMYPGEKYIFRILHWSTLPGPPCSCWRNSGLQQICCYICQTWIHLTSLSSMFWRQKATDASHQFDHPTSIHRQEMGPPAAHSAAIIKPLLRKLCLNFIDG